ncbi:MAG: cyclodeaminase/cyclohydrolase family protein [Egibacteraceae bacterium]
MDDTPYRDQMVGRFLELVASPEPAPGGGAVAAMATAMAASLVAMAARLSGRHMEDAAEVGQQADRLSQRAALLADQDAGAYREVLAAYALPKELDPDTRRARIRQALVHATDVPLEVTRVAADTAILGSLLMASGNPNLKGDAVTAVLLARAAARASATLVECNVRLGKLDGDWLDRSAAYLAAAGVDPPGDLI